MGCYNSIQTIEFSSQFHFQLYYLKIEFLYQGGKKYED
jgi:hypothetical protein